MNRILFVKFLGILCDVGVSVIRSILLVISRISSGIFCGVGVSVTRFTTEVQDLYKLDTQQSFFLSFPRTSYLFEVPEIYHEEYLDCPQVSKVYKVRTVIGGASKVSLKLWYRNICIYDNTKAATCYPAVFTQRKVRYYTRWAGSQRFKRDTQAFLSHYHSFSGIRRALRSWPNKPFNYFVENAQCLRRQLSYYNSPAFKKIFRVEVKLRKTSENFNLQVSKNIDHPDVHNYKLIQEACRSLTKFEVYTTSVTFTNPCKHKITEQLKLL